MTYARAKLRFSAAVMIMTAATSATAASLEVVPINLGARHCTEIWIKSSISSSRNKIAVTTDLSDTGRENFKAACAERGGVYSPGKCPRQNVTLVCPAQSLNATSNIILYQGSSDADALIAVCSSGDSFAGKGAWRALRTRPGRQIWASCNVP